MLEDIIAYMAFRVRYRIEVIPGRNGCLPLASIGGGVVMSKIAKYNIGIPTFGLS
jgi:hypothetical protein